MTTNAQSRLHHPHPLDDFDFPLASLFFAILNYFLFHKAEEFRFAGSELIKPTHVSRVNVTYLSALATFLVLQFTFSKRERHACAQ
jgi:hypothetical protein